MTLLLPLQTAMKLILKGTEKSHQIKYFELCIRADIRIYFAFRSSVLVKLIIRKQNYQWLRTHGKTAHPRCFKATFCLYTTSSHDITSIATQNKNLYITLFGLSDG